MQDIEKVIKRYKKMLDIPKNVKLKIKKCNMKSEGCLAIDNERIDKMENGVFEIWLSKNLTTFWFLDTLAHEMVHVKQIINGDLQVEKETFQCFWKGQSFNGVDYFNRPWERQALVYSRPMALKLFSSEFDSLNLKQADHKQVACFIT